MVIPPWNFPLAIPCGMTVAALVAGQHGRPQAERAVARDRLTCWPKSSTRPACPQGVSTVLPGLWRRRPGAGGRSRVDLIAFTGSRDVGLEINRRAAELRPGQDHVKRVIAEMGGKNAIIIDDDADLDEAVVGVLQSAFGYAGQKCSACSRVIVLDGVYDAFVARLAEAVHALPVGPAEDPDTVVGPVIDARARDRIWEYNRIARAARGGSSPRSTSGRSPTRGRTSARSSSPTSPRPTGSPRRRSSARSWPCSRAVTSTRPWRSPTGPLRPDRRPLFPEPREHRAGQARVSGRQPLHQPADHRRPGRPPAVRRVQALGHRHQGRRPGLPARVPAHPHRHREHDAARLRAGGSGGGTVGRWRRGMSDHKATRHGRNAGRSEG